MRKLSITLLLAMALVGCDAVQMKPSQSQVKETGKQLRYFRDERTQMCFAAVAQANGNTFSNAVQITWVPCTAAVADVIEEGSK